MQNSLIGGRLSNRNLPNDARRRRRVTGLAAGYGVGADFLLPTRVVFRRWLPLQPGGHFHVITATTFFVETFDVVGLARREGLRRRDMGHPVSATARFLGDHDFAGGRRAIGIEEEL